MPIGTLVVSRPSRWGNPWVAEKAAGGWQCRDTRGGQIIQARGEADAIDLALSHYGVWIKPHAATVQAELRGRDLACWCPLDQPCHADVLLAIANAPLTCEAVDG